MSEKKETKLSYDERLFLAAYRSVTGTKYQPDGKEKENNRESASHVRGQVVGYFLSALLPLPGYCFNWNDHGPFSASFEHLLDDLDDKQALADQFYEKEEEEALKELLPDCLKEPLQKAAYAVRLILETEKKEKGTYDTAYLLELLGSLTYLKRTVWPGGEFQTLNEELKYRRKKFHDDNLNERAWNCLKKTGLLKG